MKALIVDDDQMVLDCLTKLIHWEEIGCELAGVAANGMIAYDTIVENNIDIVITDIKMPLLDGIGLCKKLRENKIVTDIIFLSAYDDFQTAQIGIRYHVTDYILKPLSHDKIAHLETILLKLKEDNKKRSNYLLQLNSDSFRVFHDTALKEQNYAFFESFFEDIRENPDLNIHTIQVICIRMMNMLKNYLQMNKPTLPELSIENIVGDILTEKSTSGIIDYVYTYYKPVLYASSSKKDYETLVSCIKEYIQENFCHDWFGISSIATEFFFSIPHLNRIFKKITHTTISDYISKLRMEKAIELLTTTDMSISKIRLFLRQLFYPYLQAEIQLTPAEFRHVKRMK